MATPHLKYSLAALAPVVAVLLAACSGAAPSTRTAHTPALRRALVLSGGGPTGRAFELGMLKGLRDTGVDLTRADLIVGTSAGAVLAAQLRAGKTLDSLYDALPVTPGDMAVPTSAPGFDPAFFMQTAQMITRATEVTPAVRIAVGQRALGARNVLSEHAQFRFIDADLGGLVHQWPKQPLKLAAADLSDGTMRLFDSTQRVSIELALAASTAMPARMAPVPIGNRRYMDGFVGGPCPNGCWPNLDGAAGYDVIVVVTVGIGPAVTEQVERMRSEGSHVVVITPDAVSAVARGQIPFDLSQVKPAAEAALRQAATVAEEVRRVWNAVARRG